jgi:inorganic triphosphatase YgiF
MEIELKLLIDTADMDTLRKLDLLERHAVGKPYTQELISTYFDTPDLQVRQRDAALRVRQTGQGWVQTLKGGGKVEAGLHQRNEWEQPVHGPALDLAALKKIVDPGTEWARLLDDDALGGSLLPIFTSRITREIWEIRLPDGAEIECALDSGAVEHGEVRTPIGELELELKSGAPDALFDFALQLLDAVPMRVSNVSKAQRGYALFRHEAHQAMKAAPVALPEKARVEDGFRLIVSACLAHMQANEAGVLDGDHDPELVHQMRVAMRRLRSAFRLFDKALPTPASFQEEFKWFAGQLGGARDWDVLGDATLQSIRDVVPEEAALAELARTAADIASRERENAAAAIRSTRYTRLLLRFSRWLLGAQWRDAALDASLDDKRPAYAGSLRKFADRALERTDANLRKRGKRLHGASPAQRHKVRIAAKKARYAAEFFQSLYPQKRVAAYVKALSRLQDELGWMNDVAVAGDLLRRLAADHPGQAAAAGFARGFLASATQQDLGQLDKRWKRFTQVRSLVV